MSPAAKLKLIAYALGLLAVAHPSLVPPALGALGAAVIAVTTVFMWALAHLSLTLTVAAALLLTYAFPGIPRWFGRAWVASVAAVAPVKA